MAITNADVENYHSRSWTNLSDAKKTEMRETAERLISNQFSVQVSRLPTLKGNEDDATKFLTAHLWTLANGGEPNSEGQTGSTVSYNTVTGEWSSSLSETKYGRMFRDAFLADEQGIAIVMTK